MINRRLNKNTAGEVGEFLVVLDDTSPSTRKRIQGYPAHKLSRYGSGSLDIRL